MTSDLSLPHIIALIGPKVSGKTTLARALGQRFDYELIPFARPIKIMLRDFLAYQGVGQEQCHEMLNGDLKEVPSEFLCGNTPRFAMQTLGAEWRDLLGRDLWTNAWIQVVRDRPRVIVDDMRFLHEQMAIRFLGSNSLTFRIYRPDLHPSLDAHVSENEFHKLHADFVITNDGPPEDMLSQVEVFLNAENTLRRAKTLLVGKE